MRRAVGNVFALDGSENLPIPRFVIYNILIIIHSFEGKTALLIYHP